MLNESRLLKHTWTLVPEAFAPDAGTVPFKRALTSDTIVVVLPVPIILIHFKLDD
jgi:hypothetical protein